MMEKPRHPITADDCVAARVRERRVMLGLSQRQLAKMLGVAFQLIHKYECCTSRISAGRLYEIARILDTPIDYFYEDLHGNTLRQSIPAQRMLLDLARHLDEFQNEKHWEAISYLTKILSGH
jgi:transcriptional regulator with XRE-family HTH domain